MCNSTFLRAIDERRCRDKLSALAKFYSVQLRLLSKGNFTIVCPMANSQMTDSFRANKNSLKSVQHYSTMQRSRNSCSKEKGLHITESLHSSLCCFSPGLVKYFIVHSRWQREVRSIIPLFEK